MSRIFGVHLASKENSVAYIAIILSVLAILSVVFLISYGGKQAPEVSGRYITLTASGVAYGYPNQGLMYLFVNSTANNSSTALQNMESIVSRINSSVMPYLNGNASKIKTESYSLFKVYNSTNWEASEVIGVILPNVSNVNQVIGVLGKIDGVGIQSVQAQLSPSQFQSLLTLALQNAEQNATTQAQGIAGSGVPIQIQNITVEGYPIYYPLGLSSVPAISGGGGYNSSFFAGTTAVIRSVYVTYKIVG